MMIMITMMTMMAMMTMMMIWMIISPTDFLRRWCLVSPRLEAIR